MILKKEGWLISRGKLQSRRGDRNLQESDFNIEEIVILMG